MRVSHFLWVVSLSALSAVSSVFAGSVGGEIGNSTNNWGTGGNVTSPVTLTGDIIVPASQTLTIQPGTVVYGNNFRITVEGRINTTAGNIEEHIMLAQTALIINGDGPHTLNFVKILPVPATHANGILINNRADVTLSHVEIQDFGTNGVSVSGDATVMMNFCTIGARSRAFTPSEAISFNVQSTAGNADITIKNSILGIEDLPVIRGLAIRSATNKVRISYTFVTGDTIGKPLQASNLYTKMAPGVFDIPNARYYLDTYSPAIDAADPAEAYNNEPQPNGSRADCGFYGNTSQATKTTLQIRYPHKLTSLNHGTTCTITWWGGRFGDSKKLQFTSNKGQSWQDIGTAVPGDTSFNWTVANVKTQQAAIRISYLTHADISDTSDWFAIDTTVAYKDTLDTNRTLINPKPFACICYNGYHVAGQQPGGTEPPKEQVRADLELLKNYTHAIRTYGSGLATHGGMYVPELCDEFGIDLHLGIWLNKDIYGTTEATDKRSMDDAIAIARTGYTSIKTIVVGNEYLFRAEHHPLDMNVAGAYLLNCIRYVKANLPAGSKIKVTTGESYPNWDMDWGRAYVDSIIAEVDFLAWHVHPWWESKEISLAAEHVGVAHRRMKNRVIAAGFPNKPTVLAETGWPSAATRNAAVGSPANQGRYLQDLHTYSFANGLEYWFFEAFDEPWKGAEGDVGTNWGMWAANRNPKSVITNINTLIPRKLQWEDPDLTTAVLPPQALKPVQALPAGNFNEIRIYDLQGRMVSRITGDQQALTRSFAKASRTFLASGVFVTNYIYNGTVVKTQRSLVK